MPSGDLWLHEIKHEGFRLIARKDGDRVRLYSRPGNDLTKRFPADLKRITPQIIAVQLDQVEGVQEHVPVMLAVADTLE